MSMMCPPDVAAILLEILGQGLLQARAAGWGGDAARAAAEADHVHNLPTLIAHFTPAALGYYWDAERPAYLAAASPDQTAIFRPLWDRLQSYVEPIPEAASVR
jgi:hypothetical protein